MTEFTKRTVSPFRYDVVGSFLRPKQLKDARAKFAKGEISRNDLTQVENEAIIDLIQKEEKVGLHAVTDGEFRRSWWHLDFLWGLEGVEKAKAEEGYVFHDEVSRAETAKVVGKVGGHNHPFVQHFKFTQAHVAEGTQVKQTIPSPAQALAEFARPENQAGIKKIYGSQDDFVADLVKAYKEVISDLYDAGCRTLQLDDCTWGALADWHEHPEHIPEYGISADQLDGSKKAFVQINNAVLDGLPADLTVNTHVCRGNYHSTWSNEGGYDYVADPLFTDEKVNAFYLEYDSKRAGGFEPLAKVPDDKYVVLGLVTSKSGTLEDRQTIIDRIRKAAEFHPLDKLCLSPQCGFSSTEEGNILTEDQQWKKLEFIKSIADEVWGK